MPSPIALSSQQLLNHIGFRDWIATKAGFYVMPGERGLVCVALDRGGPLRITSALMGEALPFSILDVLSAGQLVTGLAIERTIPALPLPTLRRRRNARRLVLETELQRKRLLPHWLEWLRGAASAEEAVYGLDLWAMRHIRTATFDELAFMAQWPPAIGSRMLWALVHADAGRAVALFLHWATTGEHARFHGLGEPLSLMADGSVGTPHAEQYARLLELVVAATTNSAAG